MWRRPRTWVEVDEMGREEGCFARDERARAVSVTHDPWPTTGMSTHVASWLQTWTVGPEAVSPSPAKAAPRANALTAIWRTEFVVQGGAGNASSSRLIESTSDGTEPWGGAGVELCKFASSFPLERTMEVRCSTT